MINNANWRDIIADDKIQKYIIAKLNISGNEQRFATDNISIIDVVSKHNSGTVSTTNLSTSLTFSNAYLLTQVSDGNLFRITSTPNQRFYKINDPSSNTALTIKSKYLEASESSINYEILTNYSVKKFSAGLKVGGDATSSINLDTMSSSLSSITIEIDGFYRLQDLRTNYILTNATIEIGLWAKGLLYQDILILGKGVIRNISWGTNETSFKFTIIDLRKNLDRKFPVNKISTTNFSGATDRVVGNSYPVLYGDVVDSPCYYIGTFSGQERYLVSGHNMFNIDSAKQDGNIFVPSADGLTTDGDGNSYYYIESGSDDYSNVKVTINGKGVKTGSTYFNKAGEILEDITINYSGLSSGDIDSSLFGTAKEKLAQWTMSCIFNGYGRSESKALNTIQRRLAKQLPIIPVWRNGKYGIVVIGLDDPLSIIKLTLDKNIINMVGSITETKIENVRNSFEVIYGFSPLSGQYTKYKNLNSTNSELLKVSVLKYGLLEASTINAIDIQNDLTAIKLLEFNALLYSDVALLVTYLCTQEISVVEEGDFVHVIDPDQGWSDKLFICIRRSFSIDTVKITLREVFGSF